MTFTNAAGFSGSTVQDGQGGSTDILGINLQIINADGFNWTYETPYTQGAIAANYLASVPSSLITLKSSSTLINFNLKSIFIADYGGGDITVRTYNNGNLVGTVNLTLNTGGLIYEKTFNQSNGLTPAVFQNIDEVRFTPQGGGSMWIALNNIQIDNPVIIGPIVTTGTATAITSTSATLTGTVNPNGLSSTVSFDYGLTSAYGINIAATVGGILSALLGDTSASVTLTGLTCNTLYHFRTVSVNLLATNDGADATFTTGPCVPGTPTIGTATAGDAQASVAFTAPASNGGAAITSYTVTANPGGATGTGASSPVVVSGLNNGTAYTFTVTATNSAGTSAASAASNSITPKAGQSITFNNPGAQNFGATPALTATASSGLTVSFSSNTPGICTVSGGGALTFITAGSCTINANQAGNGSFSPAPQVSQTFTVNALVPGAPTIGTATAGNTQASVTFTPPGFTGGTNITGYTVTASPGGATGTGAASPITVTGLTNGVAYTFTVTATNSTGTSAASAASNSITPKAGQSITFNNPGAQNFGTTPTLTATASSGLTVSFTSSTTGVCSITTGGALTFVTIGTCTINSDQAGNSSFNAAPQVSQTFNVNALVPGAPTIGTATAGNTQASVTFTPPGFTGGANITGYTVTASPGGATGTGAVSPVTVTGLTNGVAYTFTATATNSVGTSAASAASNSITPAAGQTITFANPGAQNFGTTPTLTATASSGLTVSFTSSTTGVCSITTGGALTFVSAGSCTINANQAGNGSFSPAPQVSQTFTVNALVPGAPTIGTATAGNAQASVTFTPPGFNGGANITGYTVTASPGGATGTGAASPIAVTGLTNGVAYTFTVTATNSAGTSAASAASNSITPKAGQSITFNNPGAQNFGTTPTLTATASSGLTVSFSSTTLGICTVSGGGTLAFLSTGSCSINADQAGNSSINVAPTVSQSFSVIAVAPSAPSIGTATAGDAQASVAFAAPASSGGAAITSYTVTANPGGTTGTGASSPIVVSGLSNGTAYTFTVTATNSAGTSAASAASNSITPKASQNITFNNPGAQNFGTTPALTATASSGLTVSFSSTTPGICTVSGGGALTFIAAGSCTINANQAGNGSFSPAPQVSQTFNVNALVPGAPTIGTATAGDTQASVTFTAPASNGGGAITGYTVTANPGGATGTGAASPITVTGLTNGVAYTFSATATNSAGTGAASAASNSITPATGQTITFANPGAQNFGTSPTLTATASSGLTVGFTSSTTGVCTITSGGALTFVTAGTCTINADQAGNGSFSPAPQISRSFTVNAVVPGAPTIGTATAGNTQASVAFIAPGFTGGAAITGYTVTANPGGATGTGATSPVTVTGLTNGVTYTFTATATNSAGTGATSAASNSVTPIAAQTITFNNPSTQVLGTSPTLTATASSGLTVSFSTTTPSVCTITSGGVLTLISIGTCTINANQAGNANFSAAPQVGQSFMVIAGSATLALPGGGGNVALAITGTAAGCGLNSSQTSQLSPAASSSAPANLSFPYGMVSFSIAGSCANGSSATITLTYPQNLQANIQLWKYGRTSGNNQNHWYQLTAASNNLTITGNQISYTIVDGQNGDDDLTANGVILDPAAPAVPMAGAGVASIPTLGEWAMALLAALLGAMTWHQRKRLAATH